MLKYSFQKNNLFKLSGTKSCAETRNFRTESEFFPRHTIYRAKITRFGSDTREDQWESTDPRFAIRGQTLTGSSKFIRLPGIWYYLHSQVSFVIKWHGTKCMKHFTTWLPQKPGEQHIFKYWCAWCVWWVLLCCPHIYTHFLFWADGTVCVCTHHEKGVI